jgi:hypothetical protein
MFSGYSELQIFVVKDNSLQRPSTNPTDPSSWSTQVRLTTANYDGNNWWDFWPKPCKKDDSIYLFYTSERNSDDTERTDGNIWMLKLSGSHEDSEE